MPSFTWKILFCLIVATLMLYRYLEYQNSLTALRLEIPSTKKKLAKLYEDNRRLSFEVERFESPSHLLELLRHPRYSHLKYPSSEEVIIIKP